MQRASLLTLRVIRTLPHRNAFSMSAPHMGGYSKTSASVAALTATVAAGVTFWALSRKEKTAAAAAGPKSTNPLSLEERVTLLERESAANTNRAFVFVKPHAVKPSVVELVRRRLGEHNIAVVNEGVLDNNVIEEKKLVDKHYGAIASKAVLMKPKELNVSAEAQKEFQQAFGLTWDEALKKGLVYNAADACQKLKVNGADMDTKWSKLKRGKDLIKFGGGFYAGKVDDIFVINGFYMAMRAKYVDPGASIHFMVVEWDPRRLSWEDFRGKVLGATDPSTAAAGSVRREIFDNWQALGLTTKPDTGDNGVHASASPFEGLAERVNWLGVKIERDEFGCGLLAVGIPIVTVESWFSDPQVTVDGKKQSIFDTLEDMNAGEVLKEVTKIK